MIAMDRREMADFCLKGPAIIGKEFVLSIQPGKSRPNEVSLDSEDI
jgi:hypothetical protein